MSFVSQLPDKITGTVTASLCTCKIFLAAHYILFDVQNSKPHEYGNWITVGSYSSKNLCWSTATLTHQ
jgi:hypothetical protein